MQKMRALFYYFFDKKNKTYYINVLSVNFYEILFKKKKQILI